MFTFIHTSDLHLGIPFGFVSPQAAEKLRISQENVLLQIQKTAIEKAVDFLFISGDTFNSQKPDLKEIVLFSGFCDGLSKNGVKVFIIPGNHDAYSESGLWDKESFNATIFKGKDFQSIEIPEHELSIFGFPCRRENSHKRILADLGKTLSPPTKYSILLFHGAWENFGRELENDYPFSTSDIESLTFDYIALGNYHGHLLVSEKPHTYFSGAPFLLDFSDSGRHPSIIFGRFSDRLHIETIETPGIILKSEVFNINSAVSSELLQKIISQASLNIFLKLKLEGVNSIEFLKVIDDAKNLAHKFGYLEIDDSELIAPKDIPMDQTYLGRYCSELKNMLENASSDSEKRAINKAIQLGLIYFSEDNK